jgi:diguanylate cyclase (GGDEF)-like protein
MGLIHSLRLKTKLTLLFVIIGVGLFLVAVVGYANITAMKKNLDNLYFGSFTPVNELNELLLTYNRDVESTVFKLSSGAMAPFEASATLSESLDRVQRVWKSYSSHYRTGAEKAYVAFATATMERANHHITRIIDVCHQGVNVRRLSVPATSNVIADVSGVIAKLLRYEKDVAAFERRKLLETYNGTLVQLLVILGIITGAVLWISYAVFSSIRSQQQALEETTRHLKSANSKLENASNTDSLTGLYNRRCFNRIFERELKRAERGGHYIGFMMLDIDHFKSYNDTYGHLEGDSALRSVAKALQDALKRPGDYLFRLGGEEFGILITDSDPENAKTMARSLCDRVQALQIPHEGNDAGSCLTISVGVTSLVPSPSLDGNTILSMADANLYAAKEQGRNGYVFSTETLNRTHFYSRAGAA